MKKKSIVRSFRYLIEYSLVVFLGLLFRIIPLAWVHGIVRVMGFIAYRIVKVRRDVTLGNLRIAFGGKLTDYELDKIAALSYVNMGLSFVETILVPKFAGSIPDITDITELSMAKKALEQGRGLVFATGHLGSWDLCGGAIVSSGIPLTDIGQQQANPYIDKIVHDFRTRLGMKNFTRGITVKYLVKALRSGESVVLVSDQDAGSRGVFVDFFGKKASTPQGAARLVLKYQAPFMIVFAVRIRLGRYKILVRNILILPDDTIDTVTQRYTSVIEEIIRQYPEQYFWMHKRWKTPYTRNDINDSAQGKTGK